MRRISASELLDSDLGTREEIAASLCDLRFINRWFGGISTTGSMLGRVVRGTNARELSLLEVGAGSGDIPIHLVRQLRRKGIVLRVVLLDRSAAHLPPSSNGVHCVSGNAFQLPFGDASFDVVSCALLLHHFEPDEAVRFFNEALRVARIAIVINDLRRSHIHLAAVYAGFPLYLSRLTRHDAPVSVRRAYTVAELRAMLERSRAQALEIHKHFFFRMGAIAWKRTTSGSVTGTSS